METTRFQEYLERGTEGHRNRVQTVDGVRGTQVEHREGAYAFVVRVERNTADVQKSVRRMIGTTIMVAPHDLPVVIEEVTDDAHLAPAGEHEERTILPMPTAQAA